MSETKAAEPAQATAQILQPEPEAKLPAAVALRGGGAIKAIIPQDFDQAYRIARVIAASGTAPKSYMVKDPADLKEYLSVERIAVAIMHGLEVGLPPMQAVQGIAVINGMPTVYGDARDALVEASGLLEDRVEEHELDDQGLFIWWRCTVWRRGRKTPIVQTITSAQAARAGWLKKTGPWQDSPNRMAQQRARGWAYRDAFPDVLKGLVDRDEALDMVDVTRTGSAATAPPPPRRSDFVPNDEGTNGPAADGTTTTNSTPPAGGEGGAAAGPAADETQQQNDDLVVKSWKIATSIVGQDGRLKAIMNLLETTETDAEVDALEAEHKEFLDKLGMQKKSDRERSFADRKRVLAAAANKG